MGIENVRAFEDATIMRDPGPTPSRPEVNDPHQVLEIIRELDDSIERYQRDRANYIGRYKDLMSGIEEHYHAVMNRPEPDKGMESPSYGR